MYRSLESEQWERGGTQKMAEREAGETVRGDTTSFRLTDVWRSAANGRRA